MRSVSWMAALVCLLFLPGCGGGGGNSGGPPLPPVIVTTPVTFAVSWPARFGRAVAAPASALSVVFKLAGVDSVTGDFTFEVDRDATNNPYTRSYTSSSKAKSGPTTLTATFYALAGGAGSVVAAATTAVTVQADGSLLGSDGKPLGDITPASIIATVTIDPGQTVAVGAEIALTFSCRDAVNNLVAITPGSAQPVVIAGNDKLVLDTSNNELSGVAPGQATVKLTVDNVAAATQTVLVSTSAVVTLSYIGSPVLPTVAQGGSLAFTATVAPANNQAVTWSVQEVGGGAITAAGIYTAPFVPGVYHVTATSQYDPTKSATVAVTVPVAAIVISPIAVPLAEGATQIFTATVSGLADSSVTFAVTEGAVGGTITAAGVYLAPMTAGIYHVTATSKATPSLVATAVITVPAIQITLGPALPAGQTSYIVSAGLSFTFTATVTGAADTSVIWSVVEPGGGTINGVGLYTAPATAGTYHVVAKSNANPSVTQTATVVVQAGGAAVIIN